MTKPLNEQIEALKDLQPRSQEISLSISCERFQFRISAEDPGQLIMTFLTGVVEQFKQHQRESAASSSPAA